MRFLKMCCATALFFTFFLPFSRADVSSEIELWDTADQPLIIYFFRAHGCTYCEEAASYLRQLKETYPQVEIHDFDVYLDAGARLIYNQFLDHLGRTAQGMPTIIIGNNVWVGFQESYQHEIEHALNNCLVGGCPDILQKISEEKSNNTEIEETVPMQSMPAEVTIPLIGKVSLASTPLILSTLIVAFVDGFNPCSLWVLTVLLSLTLYMQSRPRTLLVGFTFIIISSLTYALFISGLFSALSYLKYHIFIQTLVSLVALIFATINIKDYFLFKQGPSLTISDQAKPNLYSHMRHLISSKKAGVSLVFGTVLLSAGISLMEFSCTAGFPIIWVNLLTTQHVNSARYIFLLALYLFIYMIDELAIFFSVAISMHSVKLDETQGRFLKLLSGLIMLALALIMLIQPNLMNNLPAVLLIFAIVITIAFLIDRVKRYLAQ